MCSNYVPKARPLMRKIVRYLEGEVALPELVAAPDVYDWENADANTDSGDVLERNSVILPNLGLMRSNNVPKARPTGTRRKGCLCPRWLRLETLDDYDVKIYNGDGDCRSERQGYFRSSAALTYWDKLIEYHHASCYSSSPVAWSIIVLPREMSTHYLATKKVEQSPAKGKGKQSRHGLNPMDMSTNLKWSLFPE
ncbi:hypothetical protein D5086_015907 [Populus alba]|uniref:Uncharacterized protein n=1 Tax=Populus alba TaxID=43335 RepID=A0ACC4BT50_POPAL